jgi:hypothetical protein
MLSVVINMMDLESNGQWGMSPRNLHEYWICGKVDRVDRGLLIFYIITNFQQGGSSDGAQPQGLDENFKTVSIQNSNLFLTN